MFTLITFLDDAWFGVCLSHGPHTVIQTVKHINESAGLIDSSSPSDTIFRPPSSNLSQSATQVNESPTSVESIVSRAACHLDRIRFSRNLIDAGAHASLKGSLAGSSRTFELYRRLFPSITNPDHILNLGAEEVGFCQDDHDGELHENDVHSILALARDKTNEILWSRMLKDISSGKASFEGFSGNL